MYYWGIFIQVREKLNETNNIIELLMQRQKLDDAIQQQTIIASVSFTKFSKWKSL